MALLRHGPFLKHSMYFPRNIHHPISCASGAALKIQDTALLRATDCAFAITPLAMVDLIAVLPFYLPFSHPPI